MQFIARYLEELQLNPDTVVCPPSPPAAAPAPAPAPPTPAWLFLSLLYAAPKQFFVLPTSAELLLQQIVLALLLLAAAFRFNLAAALPATRAGPAQRRVGAGLLALSALSFEAFSVSGLTCKLCVLIIYKDSKTEALCL